MLWKWVDRALEVAVPLSYGAPGFRVRQRVWGGEGGDALDVDLRGRTCLVTGANAGLGRATTRALAERGARVIMVCRNPERGQAALEDLRAEGPSGELHLELADISDLASVRALAERVRASEAGLHVLVNNAGVMLDARQETASGIEQSFATNVLGAFLLTRELEPLLRASAPARIIHVTSGGMYTQRLDVDDLQWRHKPYDGVRAYAQTKRAQVILSEQWAERLAGSGVTSNTVHPGWADTPGVQTSLPRFARWLSPLLRDAEQGADTVVWLAASEEAQGESGKLWFDRRARRTHVLPGTRSTPAERQKLWALCEALADGGCEPIPTGAKDPS